MIPQPVIAGFMSSLTNVRLILPNNVNLGELLVLHICFTDPGTDMLTQI